MNADREARRTAILERALALASAGEATLDALRAEFPEDGDLVREVWAELERDEASRQTRVGANALASGTALTPRRIGRFLIQRQIGRGGQGEVYEARDEHLDRPVALKVLSRRLDLLDPEAGDRVRARFRREAEAAARLDHPGVCAVYDSGVEEGIPWIAMQLVRGHSLAELIDRRRNAGEGSSQSTLYDPVSAVDQDAATVDTREPAVSPPPRTESTTRTASHSHPSRAEIDESLLVVEAAARALHASHRAGLVHRDVKPGNIMVTDDLRPIILDFGLAADEKSEGPALTVTGDFLGSPAYMSPEQARGLTGSIDRRTDVWGLGVTLFECLTLRRPFESPSREGLLRDIATAEPPSLRMINPQIERDLEIVVHCALEKDPDRRYDTAEALAEDIRRIREHEPILARPSGPLVRLSRWRRRNPVLATLIASLIAFIVIGGTWSTLKRRELQGLNSELADVNQKLGGTNTELERTNGRLGEVNQELRSTIADYERMADVKRLQNARAESRDLWPISPELVPRIRAWQERYADIIPRLAEHEAARDALRERGRYDEATKSWEFGDDYDAAFRHDIVDRLVTDLARFADEESGLPADVGRRLILSENIERSTIDKHAERWRAAAARVAKDDRFPGFDLKPVLGLVPLGPDPQSGLEEFLHWTTHSHAFEPTYPTRNDEGRFEPRVGDGLILVLIPGGSFLMGTQKDDPNGPNYDPLAYIGDEYPLHEVKLAPYFISKFEMNQAQWKRATGQVPSYFQMGMIHPLEERKMTALLPVEQVSFNSFTFVLKQLGLQVPTEAQWERAARGGTDKIWPWTSKEAELGPYANVGGVECAEHFSPVGKIHRDPYVVTVEVGRMKPNAYGLYDVIGNVFEWTRDTAHPYSVPARDGDGLRTSPDDNDNRSCRGGAFRYAPKDSRVATRFPQLGTSFVPYVGVRPSLDYPHD